jgi:hypothetical protein
VLADFLEMADHLVREKLLLPAAVVAGAALEAHLRAMASKAGITTGTSGKPKRAGKLNDDLKAKGVVQNMTQGIRDFIVRYPA